MTLLRTTLLDPMYRYQGSFDTLRVNCTRPVY
jgi:hypothetical protein